MAVTGVSGTAATSAAPGTDKTTLIGNYEAFLQLLTAQLKAQSPLAPMDANEFTQQLVQFSTVEQAIKTNDRLDQLIGLSLSNQATAMIGLLGAKVTAEGSTSVLAGGKAAWGYNAASDGKAKVTIRDANGAEVFTKQIDIAKGEGTFDWDGKLATGELAPDGQYSITIDASDSAGNHIDVSTKITGVVDGLDFSGSVPGLKIGDVTIPVTALLSVSKTG